MRLIPYLYSDFSVEQHMPRDSDHLNDIELGVLEGHGDTRWYAKKTPYPNVACRNLFAGELYRLICPNPHPRTFIVRNDDTNQWYLFSEKLGSSYDVATTEELSLEDNGLADILVTSLWLNEVDLKQSNLLLDKENRRLAKIDAEWCFHSLIMPEHQHDITSYMISALPFPHQYPSHNWLSYLEDNSSFEKRMFPRSTTLPASFNADRNRALLRICLLPDSFLMSLAKLVLFKADQLQFLDFLLQRSEQIQEVVALNESFKSYIQSPEAKQDMSDFFELLKNFRTQGVQIAENIRILETEYIENCRGMELDYAVEKENQSARLSAHVGHCMFRTRVALSEITPENDSIKNGLF